ncbi:suppressor of disruption of TFIIS-like isoform X2 [Wolffia australiana]
MAIFDCILFDLDDTLYSSDVGIAGFLRKNIEEFLMMTCGITAEDAFALRSELFKTYGSSLVGLRARGYNIHPDDYHSFVHGRLPYDLIRPNPSLRDLLQSIPQRRIIFTNSDMVHATRSLERLGLTGCFDGIICFETLNPDLFGSKIVLKPSVTAFNTALSISGVNPRRVLFLDDSEKNIASAKAIGLRTALKRPHQFLHTKGSRPKIIGDMHLQFSLLRMVVFPVTRDVDAVQ